MRKTLAPSQCQNSKTISAKGITRFADGTRSTSQLLNILSTSTSVATFTDNLEVNKSPICSPNDTKVDNAIDHDNILTKRYFNVVWGKQTKRKHKTWEGDGTIEVEDNFAILKDENGTVLGRTSKLKNVNLEEGNRLFVGSKEVEIIEEKNKEDRKESRSENDDVTMSKITSEKHVMTYKAPFKRRKTSKGISSVYELDDDLLTMPRPDYAHQWKFNDEKLPITDVKLDLFLSKVLRSHQREGVLFLYSCVTGIRDVEYNGAILADEMGLGKTLQCVSLVWILLKNGPYGGIPLIKRVLIVTPSSLTLNWLKEFKRWLGFQRLEPFVVDQKQKPSDYAKLPASLRPVMIISYEMLARHYDDIKNISFDLLICDEGHRLKNLQIRISQFLSSLNINRKIILTGTPVQNNLQEYFALIDFVNPGILGSYQEFKKYFEAPILTANEPECDEETKAVSESRSAELNHRTNNFILRRTQDLIDQYLPLKQECVVFCSPSQLQIELYDAVVSYWENNLCSIAPKIPHLSVITMLKKICNHPSLIRTGEASLVEYNNDFEEFEIFKDSVSNILKPVHEKFSSKSGCAELSGKMATLENFLSELHSLNEKVVLISYYTQTLSLFEVLCKRNGYNFLRLDGNTSSAARLETVEKFNSPSSKYFVFLLSAKAGGVGLNLIGASRLVLFDLDWNPASDLQAMSRIWRDGQKKNVYIYRFLMSGSIEEKIFQRQISKKFLSDAVVDMHCGPNVKLSNEELKDLFSFKHNNCGSSTHELLACKCTGNGIPEVPINHIMGEEDERDDCQLSISNQKKKNVLKIKELLEWEHYSKPVNDVVLKELCLKSSSQLISYLFRNKNS